jgi:hypothetical protein
MRARARPAQRADRAPLMRRPADGRHAVVWRPSRQQAPCDSAAGTKSWPSKRSPASATKRIAGHQITAVGRHAR